MDLSPAPGSAHHCCLRRRQAHPQLVWMLELKCYGGMQASGFQKELLSPAGEGLIRKAQHRAPHCGGVMPSL